MNTYLLIAILIVIVAYFILVNSRKKKESSATNSNDQINTKPTEDNLAEPIEENNDKPIPSKVIKQKKYMVKNKMSTSYTIKEFDNKLEEWLINCDTDTIGDISKFGGRKYIYVKVGPNEYYLNADTKRPAVKEYLNKYKGEKWEAILNQKKTKKNKVAFGTDQKIIKGFYFYLKLE